MGAETAGVGGLQRQAIVSRREAVDGVRAPQRVKRVEQLRAEAVTVVPQSRKVQELVCPHIELDLAVGSLHESSISR